MLNAQLRIIGLRLCECQVLCSKGRDEKFIVYPVWASVTNGSNHWILRQPDQVNKTDPWPGGHEVLFAATSDRLPSHQRNKDARATDSCFAVIRAHSKTMLCEYHAGC